jgi:nucleoside-diphosphate-sugar epimerase
MDATDTFANETNLTVAVTGPTGTFGFGLIPQLQADDRVSRIIGIARRPFDPAEHGWTKMEYRQGDVRDPEALQEAFQEADVVVHLAFLIVSGNRETTRAINVDGTLNAFRAAAQAGVRRFVYASSVAAYGWHPDNPVGMEESWPIRPADRLFYAQEKAELEHLLQDEAREHLETKLYLLRPPIVLGPHTIGGKELLPKPLAPLGRLVQGRKKRLPVPVPAVVPDMPVQFVHEDDVGSALLQCIVGAGAPGAYNIAAEDVLSAVDVAREVGVVPIRVPAKPAHEAARLLARLPLLPSTVQWIEAASHPSVMDTTRARTELGWKPRWTAIEALRETLGTA